MFGLFDSKIRPNSAEFSSNEYSYWLTKHNMSRIPPHDAHTRNVLGMGFLAAKKAVPGSLRPEVNKILTTKLKGSH